MLSVEARYLGGESVLLDPCDTVGGVMAQIAVLQGRLASDVIVIAEGQVLDLSATPPPVISVVLKSEEAEGLDELHTSLHLHAECAHVSTCVRILEILRRRSSAHVGEALCSVAATGSVTSMKVLLRAGACADQANNLGETVLMRASRKCRKDMVAALLSARASVDIGDNNGITALICASSRDKHGVELLLAAGACVDLGDLRGLTPLMHAVMCGCKEGVNMLLQARANVDRRDHIGMTALMFASQTRHRYIAELLLEHGASVDLAANDGRTALIFALQSGPGDVVETLLLAGASVDIADESGRTAAMYALDCGREDLVSMLGEAGAKYGAYGS